MINQCEFCGSEHKKRNYRHRFCSDRCKIAWHRYQKRVESGRGNAPSSRALAILAQIDNIRQSGLSREERAKQCEKLMFDFLISIAFNLPLNTLD